MSARLLAVLVVAAVNAGAQGVGPTPTIQVRVVDESGNAIEKGRAEIVALKRWAYVERGLVTISELRQGTWTVVVTAPGYHPDSVSLVASLKPADAVLRLRSTGLAVVEERDTVAFTPSARDSALLKEIAVRMRAGHGTLFTWKDLVVRTAQRASDPLRSARGFRWLTENTIKTTTGCVTLAIYVDGNRIASALESVNRMVPPTQILAIEAYADLATTPLRWRSSDACAAVAYWTKR